jgi:biotin carboxylase
MKPWFIFIESNTSGTGQLFVKHAHTLGYTPVVLAQNPSRYPYLADGSIATRVVDTARVDLLKTRIDQLIEEAPLAGIYSSSDYFVEVAAELSQHYRLPGADPQALKACRNKFTQRLGLQSAGLRVPHFSLATSAAEALEALDKISLPVVIKPTCGSGSVGVRLCRTLEEVLSHAEQLLQLSVNERGIPRPREVLVEEYLRGPEYSVEVFQSQAIGVTRKLISSEPYFVEIGHDFPAELSDSAQSRITEEAIKGIQRIGPTWGPAHVELRLTPNGPVIVEINARLAGGFIPRLVSLACGVDLIQETIRLAAGLSGGLEDRDSHPHAQAAIRFLLCDSDGMLEEIEAVDEVRGIRDVYEVQVYKKLGETVGVHHDFRDRIAHVISVSTHGEAASISAELATSKMKARIRVNVKDYGEHRQDQEGCTTSGASHCI